MPRITPMVKKKKGYHKKHAWNRTHRTGEDIAMLNERKIDPQAGESGSVRYKDHIDGA